MGVDLFSDLRPRITKDDEEATNSIIPWLDNLSKTTLMGPVPKYIVFKVLVAHLILFAITAQIETYFP